LIPRSLNVKTNYSAIFRHSSDLCLELDSPSQKLCVICIWQKRTIFGHLFQDDFNMDVRWEAEHGFP